MKRLIFTFFVMVVFIFFFTFLFFTPKKTNTPPLNTLAKNSLDQTDIKYTMRDPELTITTESYTVEGENTIQVKTCKCHGCHWRCSE